MMGKNTTMRKAIRGHLDQNPLLEKILPCIKGNVGFVFTTEDLSDIRELIEANKVRLVMLSQLKQAHILQTPSMYTTPPIDEFVLCSGCCPS